VYRLNTFPLLHVGFIHMIVNIFALTPLLERFEAENGSLPTLLLFTGRSSTLPFSIAPSLTNLPAFGLLPGGSYTLIEKFIFHANTAVQGAR